MTNDVQLHVYKPVQTNSIQTHTKGKPLIDSETDSNAKFSDKDQSILNQNQNRTPPP